MMTIKGLGLLGLQNAVADSVKVVFLMTELDIWTGWAMVIEQVKKGTVSGVPSLFRAVSVVRHKVAVDISVAIGIMWCINSSVPGVSVNS